MHAGLLLSLKAGLAAASALVPRDINERVLLVNCDNGVTTSSRAFWYPSADISTTPGGQAIVVQPIGSFLWEAGPARGKFGDGNTFASNTRWNCPANAYAGSATNSHNVSFYCYRRSNQSLGYTTVDGSKCYIVYECNRTRPSDTDPRSNPGCKNVNAQVTSAAPQPVVTKIVTSAQPSKVPLYTRRGEAKRLS